MTQSKEAELNIMESLTGLPNIGIVLAQCLIEVGISTHLQLKEIGSKEAWLRIRARDPSACLSKLMALEGAISGVRWHNLDEVKKKELKEFFNRY